jgi:hypothetical protein
MEKKTKQSLHELKMLLFQKGYRKRFSLVIGEDNRNRYHGELGKCLDVLGRALSGNPTKGTMVSLETTAPFNDRITCSFTITIDESGLGIKELMVQNLRSKESRQFTYRNNKEIPGSQSLEGLFPKPKPWDRLLRGKL